MESTDSSSDLETVMEFDIESQKSIKQTKPTKLPKQDICVRSEFLMTLIRKINSLISHDDTTIKRMTLLKLLNIFLCCSSIIIIIIWPFNINNLRSYYDFNAMLISFMVSGCIFHIMKYIMIARIFEKYLKGVSMIVMGCFEILTHIVGHVIYQNIYIDSPVPVFTVVNNLIGVNALMTCGVICYVPYIIISH